MPALPHHHHTSLCCMSVGERRVKVTESSLREVLAGSDIPGDVCVGIGVGGGGGRGWGCGGRTMLNATLSRKSDVLMFHSL